MLPNIRILISDKILDATVVQAVIKICIYESLSVTV